MEKGTAKLLHFGQGGHTIHFTNKPYSRCTLSGYCNPDNFCKASHWWADPIDNLNVPDKGIPVVNVRDAVNTPDGFSWVFRGPMVDVDLEDNKIDQFCEERRGGLDFVNVTDYVRGWQEHGAKIGWFRVENGVGKIEWL